MSRGPHWMLTDADAKNYGAALANALRHLPIQVAQKYLDFGALGLAVLAYNGPRLAMDHQLRRAAREAAARATPNVFSFTPRSASGAAQEAAPQSQAGPAADMTYEPEIIN